MRAYVGFAVWAALAVGALAGCGSAVVTDSSAGAGGGSGGGGGNGGMTISCGGVGPTCVLQCGSDALLEAECTNDGLVCPEGSVDINDCPAGTCVGKPPPCSACEAGAFVCAPELCINECPEIMCGTCPPDGEVVKTDTCACACNDSGQFVCKKTDSQPMCCVSDLECGDESFVPCVNGVCKSPVPDAGCWADSQCPSGTACVDAFVCPCGVKCDMPDKPGLCSGP